MWQADGDRLRGLDQGHQRGGQGEEGGQQRRRRSRGPVSKLGQLSK